MRPPRSVRARITVISTALVAVTLALASLLLVRLVQADLLASAQETLDLALQAQADGFIIEEFPDDELEGSALDDGELVVGTGPAELYTTVIDGQVIELSLFTLDEEGAAAGTLYVDGFAAALLLLDPEAGEVLEVLDPRTGIELQDPEVVEQIESLTFETIELSDAEGRLLVGATPLQEIEESIEALRDALLLIVPALVIGFGLLTWWLVGRALRPVQSITDQVQAISTTNLDRRVPVPETGDEVAELAVVMNRMLDRLERGGERQRQFSADASHELRSPLSTVRAAAELLGRVPPPERAAGLADDIVAETDRMDVLIGDLLELAKIDEGGIGAGVASIDLVALVSTELADDVGAGRVELSTMDDSAATTPASITGARRQLRRVIRNLVDNAIRHADERVVVALLIAGDAVEVTVDDDGAGVPSGTEAVIFERFRRLDEARSRDGGGSGLGLALVASIVESHGGSVRVGRAPIGGARFTVALPLSLPPDATP